MVMADITQKDVYTPEEAEAFHEGFTKAFNALIAGQPEPVSEPQATPALAEAFEAGMEHAKPKFDEIAYRT